MADEWIQLTMVHGRVYNNDEIVMEWVVASGKKKLGEEWGQVVRERKTTFSHDEPDRFPRLYIDTNNAGDRGPKE